MLALRRLILMDQQEGVCATAAAWLSPAHLKFSVTPAALSVCGGIAQSWGVGLWDKKFEGTYPLGIPGDR